MSDNIQHHYSITISDKQLNILKRALLIYNNDVVANPKKNFDVKSFEILELAKLIDDRDRWKTP
jgi:hypothetical protein